VHSPLKSPDSTRVLILEPASSFDARIAISVKEVSLHDNPRYEALSYSWDGQNATERISCQGRSLLVTRNCHLALKWLRLPRKKRALWIDSISINQEDVLEKSAQVGFMHDIYAMASRTVVWLGEPDAQASLAFEQLRAFASESSRLDAQSSAANFVSRTRSQFVSTSREWLHSRSRLL